MDVNENNGRKFGLVGRRSSSKEKYDEDGNKIHGMGIMCSLRKLSPPKKAPASRSSSDNSQMSTDMTEVSSSPSTVASIVASSPGVHPVYGSLYFCPALNCYQKLRSDEVVYHAQEVHSLVVSDLPDRHNNSIEVSERDMVPGEGSAAWAPTLLTAFGTSFFFETWRNANGKWYMWVYHLGSPENSAPFVADLEISNDLYRLGYSGPVYSLSVPQTKITTSGRCLSFSDGLAQSMLQKLEDNNGVTGICYKVRVRRIDVELGGGETETTQF